MAERLDSFQTFWPYYLSEHSDPRSRRLHFVGTTGFLACCVGSVLLNPLLFPMAVVGMALIGWHGLTVAEPKKRSLLHVVAMIALPTLASPALFPAGVVIAYGFAWTGHFGFEKNRPATFQYPVMSFAGDLRMWAEMLRGRLWSTDDPVAELGLEEQGETFFER